MGKQKQHRETSQSESGESEVAVNRKAWRDYEILEKIESGVVLLGSEVKSIRAGGLNLKDSYVTVKNGEMYLVSAHIGPYAHARADAHAPERERKLLLHKKEIERIAMRAQQKGLTIIPLRAYFRKGKCKFELALGRGKKHFDKREDVKAREAKRRMERALKGVR